MPFSATRDLWLVLKARDEGARAMKSFSRDIRMVGDSVKQANLIAARSSLRNQLATQRLTGATQSDILATQRRINKIDDEIGKMNVARAALEEHRVSAQKLSATMTGVSATMTAVGTGLIAAGVFGAAGLNNLVNSAMAYQKQASLTRTQVDGFTASLKDMEDIGIRVADKIGVAFNQVQPALFDIFSSMEVNQKQAEDLLNIFAKAAVAGQTDIQSASKATIGILNAFQLPISAVNHLMDVQFQLVQEGVGTYEEWTQRIGLVSPSAVRAGQSVEMMAAALAATTRMGISAARSGTAVARAFDAISNPAAVEGMKALGVNAQDATGKFRPIIDILKDFRTALQKVPEKDKIGAILDVFKGAGGTIEARRFLQNMLLTPGNLEMFKSIFEEMSTESGSFEKAYSIMADTAATKSQLIANKWEILKVKAGEALIPTFLQVIEKVGKLFDAFNRLDPKTQKIIAKIAAWGVALMIVSGILLLVVGTLAAFIAAVAVAGSALFVVLGILGAVAAAVIGFGTAIAIAWNKSAAFRNIIIDIGKDLKAFYKDYVLPTAKTIKDAFNTYMLPPLQKLAEVIETKVLPIFRDLNAFARSQFLNGLKEIGNIIKDVLIWSFKHIGEVITKYVIPAIEKLAQFYHNHEGAIKRVVAAIVFLGKWMLKIAVIAGIVLAAVLGGVLVIAIAGLIAAIVGIIAVIVLLIKGFKAAISWIMTNVPKAWNAVADFTSRIWNNIVSFFVGIWNSITGVVSNGWNAILGFFDTIGALIAKRWYEFWNTKIGGLLGSVLNLIIALVKLIFTAILFVFEWGVKIIRDVWDAAWASVVFIVTGVWNVIVSFLTQVWNLIVDIAKVIWGRITQAWNETWSMSSNIVTEIWNTIFSYLRTIWNNIVLLFKTIWSGVNTYFGRLWDDVVKIVSDAWNRITSFFSNAWNILFEAGRNIVGGLIDGMKSQIDGVTAIIESITKRIRDYLPYSPAKIGPLSGKGNPYLAGQKISRMIAGGMASEQDLISKASNIVASSVGTKSPSLTGVQTTGRTYNQQIVINTNEINPRRHAAELGTLLAGGM